VCNLPAVKLIFCMMAAGMVISIESHLRILVDMQYIALHRAMTDLIVSRASTLTNGIRLQALGVETYCSRSRILYTNGRQTYI
jgi:hypothetical protein